MTQIALIPTERPKTEFGHVPLSELPDEHIGPKPDTDLIQSVKDFGVLEPVLLRKGRGGAWQVLGGRRRIAALRKALADAPEEEKHQYRTIPAIIIDGLNPTTAAVTTITVHATRRENAAMELKAVEELLARGSNERDICTATGLDPSQIRALMKLQRLNPTLRAVLERGKMSPRVAAMAAKLPADAQARLAEKANDGERVTADDVRAARQVQASTEVTGLPSSIFATPPTTEAPAEHAAEDSAAMVDIADVLTDVFGPQPTNIEPLEALRKIAMLLPKDLRPELPSQIP